MYNIILDTDSYKVSMYKQYPPKTEKVYSYVEARGGEMDYSIFFGLQYYLKKYLSQKITTQMVIEAAKVYKQHGVPFNKDGWMYIAKDLDGKLPLIIKAVPEGTKVPTGNILVSVENTDTNCFWLTTWVETSLLRVVWYASTVATYSHYIKDKIKEFYTRTGTSLDNIDFNLHDFGARGVSSMESAMLGGAAHLLSFKGTDTTVAPVMLQEFYSAKTMPGFSIPAAEHSTITAWGRTEEAAAYKNMLYAFSSYDTVAIVSDSYNIYDAVDNIWGRELKEDVLNFKGTVVVRPDSGNPVTVVSSIVQKLENIYGVTYNDLGYKLLNKVRVIQGDGVDLNTILAILAELERLKYSPANVSFGMGGALLQKLNRDTLGFSMKASSIRIDGKDYSISKSPVDDSKKASKSGKLILTKDKEGNYETVSAEYSKDTDYLRVVYLNGKLLNTIKFSEVLTNIKQN